MGSLERFLLGRQVLDTSFKTAADFVSSRHCPGEGTAHDTRRRCLRLLEPCVGFRAARQEAPEDLSPLQRGHAQGQRQIRLAFGRDGKAACAVRSQGSGQFKSPRLGQLPGDLAVGSCHAEQLPVGTGHQQQRRTTPLQRMRQGVGMHGFAAGRLDRIEQLVDVVQKRVHRSASWSLSKKKFGSTAAFRGIRAILGEEDGSVSRRLSQA